MQKFVRDSSRSPGKGNKERTGDLDLLGMTDEEIDQRRSEIDDRLVRPAQDDIIPKCKSAALVDAKVELLGQEYNALEERTYQADRDIASMKTDLTSLKERLKPYEDYKTEVLHATQKLAVVQASISNLKANPRDSPLAEELTTQKALVQDLQQRLELLEHRNAVSDTALSTHELAQALLSRFERGDILQTTMAVQLQTTLSSMTGINAPQAPDQLLRTPALTEAPTRQTTASEVPSSDEPPRKRQRGRPPTHGRYVRKLSVGSTLSDVVSKTNETPGARSKASEGPSASSKSKKTPESDTKLASTTKEIHASDGSAEIMESQEKDEEGMDVDDSGEQAVIPPERRSARKTQRTKQFGDTVSWKEANLQVKRMRPSAP